MDILKGYREIDKVKKELQNVRSTLDKKYTEWFDEVKALGEYIRADPNTSEPIQRYLDCAQSESRNSGRVLLRAAPFLDHLFTDLNTRFTKGSSVIVKGFIRIRWRFI